MDNETLIPAKAVAAALGVCTKTVHRLKAKGLLPQPIRVGGSERWRRSDLEKFLNGSRDEGK